MRGLLRRTDRVLTPVENALSAVGTAVMAAIMLIVTADVGMRYALNRPLGWSYDLIDLYLSVFLFYLMLSFAFRRHGHIRVDIVQQYLGRRARAAFEAVTCLTAFAVFGAITVVSAQRCWSQWQGGDLVQGDVDWPSWLSTFAVPLGSGLLSLRLLVNGLAHGVAAATGEYVVPLPPLHAETSAEPGVMAE